MESVSEFNFFFLDDQWVKLHLCDIDKPTIFTISYWIISPSLFQVMEEKNLDFYKWHLIMDDTSVPAYEVLDPDICTISLCDPTL